jgi:alanine-glyoxylate transaminase / serine-glyoxylate transaminase / serine-pyruvate transaminase
MPGFNTLAIPGPTNMPFEVRAAMDVALEDHRSPDLPGFVIPLLADVAKVFRTATGKVVIFPSSGTGGWEAAITNTLSPGDRVLIPVFGQFSHLWADMCRHYGLDVDVIDTPWGEGAPLEIIGERLAADKGHKIKSVMICHNETATGVTSDVVGVRAAMNSVKHPALLMVDGVSSIASIEFRMDDWGVDVAVAGSQKGFMLPAGLGIVAFSPKALHAMTTAKLPRCFFSVSDMLKSTAGGYFPYTPAMTLLRGLRKSVDMLLGEGIDNVAGRHNRIASGVRAAVIDGWGLKLCAKEAHWHSDTVSAIVVPEHVDAAKIISVAGSDYQLSLGSGLSKVAGRVFRIGHLGWMNELMALQAVAGAEMAMRDCGLEVAPGSGVGAAQEVYRAQKRAAREATFKIAAE